MSPLSLVPLPVTRADGASPDVRSAWEDFVSEEAVNAVLAANRQPRPMQAPDLMALSSCDEDFAGHGKGPARFTAVPEAAPAPVTVPEFVAVPEPQPLVFPSSSSAASTATGVFAPVLERGRIVRAAPPEPDWERAATGSPARGHRWWIAGLSGAVATFVFAGVLFALANRSVPAEPRPAVSSPDAPLPEKPGIRPEVASVGGFDR